MELKPQVEMAQASVAVSQAMLDRLQADRTQTLAVLRTNYSRAQTTRSDLFPNKAISQSDLDKITFGLENPQAGVARSRSSTDWRQQTVDLPRKGP